MTRLKKARTAPEMLRVVQDRVTVGAKSRARLAEAVESALR